MSTDNQQSELFKCVTFIVLIFAGAAGAHCHVINDEISEQDKRRN